MSKNMKEMPGTPLSGKELKSDKVITFKWRPNAKYAWSAGIAYGRFLDELKAGRIIGRKCSRCERIIVPPRMFCEHCFVATDEWVYVKDTGTINTFSLSYLDADANRIKDPILVAVIDIDGASPGVGILHLLGNVDPDKIDVGMKVKAVWKPPEEREGSVTDILFWEPLED
ncbi:MAG: Zn-ribbon domain-containing OB-fold protein [Candidatus Hermodarchaeota archaeon]